MKQIDTSKLKSTWQAAVNLFERGDLVPLMVLVSAVHYGAVLAGKDHWAVAVAIGLLVDLGHYRTIRYATTYRGALAWERVARWGIAVVMTSISFAYHWRYYQDFLLAAPLPFLIAVLAWLPERKPSARAEASPAQETVKAIDKPLPELDTRGKLLAYFGEFPQGTLAEAGKAAGVSRQRVGQILEALEAEGVIHRNGKVTVK
jgi:hypothetical protein